MSFTPFCFLSTVERNRVVARVSLEAHSPGRNRCRCQAVSYYLPYVTDKRPDRKPEKRPDTQPREFCYLFHCWYELILYGISEQVKNHALMPEPSFPHRHRDRQPGVGEAGDGAGEEPNNARGMGREGGYTGGGTRDLVRVHEYTLKFSSQAVVGYA